MTKPAEMILVKRRIRKGDWEYKEVAKCDLKYHRVNGWVLSSLFNPPSNNKDNAIV